MTYDLAPLTLAALRSLSNDEVNQVQNQVIARLKEQFAVEIR
jgi:phenylalanyl-tRNA synthetase beta subunit